MGLSEETNHQGKFNEYQGDSAYILYSTRQINCRNLLEKGYVGFRELRAGLVQ